VENIERNDKNISRGRTEQSSLIEARIDCLGELKQASALGRK
jgi:hypothetical protein